MEVIRYINQNIMFKHSPIMFEEEHLRYILYMCDSSGIPGRLATILVSTGLRLVKR